jgi:hypothetical protein
VFRDGPALGLVLAAAYVAVLMGAVFPALAPGGYVYGERLYGDFARDCREVARTTRGTVLLACPTEGGESAPFHGGDSTSPPERGRH